MLSPTHYFSKDLRGRFLPLSSGLARLLATVTCTLLLNSCGTPPLLNEEAAEVKNPPRSATQVIYYDVTVSEILNLVARRRLDVKPTIFTDELSLPYGESIPFDFSYYDASDFVQEFCRHPLAIELQDFTIGDEWKWDNVQKYYTTQEPENFLNQRYVEKLIRSYYSGPDAFPFQIDSNILRDQYETAYRPRGEPNEEIYRCTHGEINLTDNQIDTLNALFELNFEQMEFDEDMVSHPDWRTTPTVADQVKSQELITRRQTKEIKEQYTYTKEELATLADNVPALYGIDGINATGAPELARKIAQQAFNNFYALAFSKLVDSDNTISIPNLILTPSSSALSEHKDGTPSARVLDTGTVYISDSLTHIPLYLCFPDAIDTYANLMIGKGIFAIINGKTKAYRHGYPDEDYIMGVKADTQIRKYRELIRSTTIAYQRCVSNVLGITYAHEIGHNVEKEDRYINAPEHRADCIAVAASYLLDLGQRSIDLFLQLVSTNRDATFAAKRTKAIAALRMEFSSNFNAINQTGIVKYCNKHSDY